jgi:hypothetical protein
LNPIGLPPSFDDAITGGRSPIPAISQQSPRASSVAARLTRLVSMPSTTKTRATKTRAAQASTRRGLKSEAAEVTCPAQEKSLDSTDQVASAMAKSRRTSTATITSDASESLHEQKKYRNRTSAVRHRRRKKEMESDLEAKEKILVEQHENLKRGIEELKNERLELKSMLMSHSMCGFAPIDHYHLQSAQSVSNGGAMSAIAASQAASQAALQKQQASGPSSTNGPTYTSSSVNDVPLPSTAHPSTASPQLTSSQLASPIEGSPTFPLQNFMTPTDNSSDTPISSRQLNTAASNASYDQQSLSGLPSDSAPFGMTASRKEKVQRTTSTASTNSADSTDSGYHQPSHESPDSVALDDMPEPNRMHSFGADDMWSVTGPDPPSTFTSTNTTPAADMWKGFQDDSSTQFDLRDAPLFDNVCCPMDTIMEKQPHHSHADDEFLNSLFPLAD